MSSSSKPSSLPLDPVISSLIYPDSLLANDAQSAVEKAISDNDVQDSFYVNFIPLQRTSHESFHQLLASIDSSRHYWSTTVELNVQDQVGKGTLPSEVGLEPGFTRSAYRVRVLDYLVRTSPWLIFNHESGSTDSLSLGDNYHDNKATYQRTIGSRLADSRFSERDLRRITLVSKYIAELLSLTQTTGPAIKRFSVVFTSDTLTSRAVLRIVAFEISSTARDGGGVEVSVEIRQYEAYFNKADFDEAEKLIDPAIFDLGSQLTWAKTVDIVDY